MTYNSYKEQYEAERKMGYEYSIDLEEKWKEMLVQQYMDYVNSYEDAEEAMYYCVVDYSVYPITVKNLIR